jgi:hypothetical protein
MKYVLLILAILIIAFNHAQACKNSAPESVVRAMTKEQEIEGKECKDLPDEQCICFDGIDVNSAELVDNMVLDFIRKENAVSCTDEADCLAKEAEQVCTLGKVIRTESEVYCAVEVMKADGKKLVESESKKAAREAAAAIKAAQDAALASAMKAMDCGKSAQAAMLVRNAAKNLTTTQVKQIVAAYAPIKGLLDTGSLQSSIEEIQAIQADGVLVTEADKEAIIAHINQCRQ